MTDLDRRVGRIEARMPRPPQTPELLELYQRLCAILSGFHLAELDPPDDLLRERLDRWAEQFFGLLSGLSTERVPDPARLCALIDLGEQLRNRCRALAAIRLEHPAADTSDSA